MNESSITPPISLESRYQTVIDWIIEKDWEAYGGSELWHSKQDEIRNEGRVAVSVSLRADKAIDAREMDQEPYPLGLVFERCLEKNGGRGICDEEHQALASFPCGHPHHNDCVPRSLVQLLIGMKEKDNPGHRPLMEQLGGRLSIWYFERGPYDLQEVMAPGSKSIENARKLLGKQIERWISDRRVFHGGDRIILNEQAGTLTVRRYVLAAGDVTPGNKKEGVGVITRGETYGVVKEYINLVGGAWTVGRCDKETADYLVRELKGKQRVRSYQGFDEVLDEVVLDKPCPVCGGHLRQEGWMTANYEEYIASKPGGTYLAWKQRPLKLPIQRAA